MIAAFMVPRESICKSCENRTICGKKILEERNACMTGCSRYEKEHKPTNADRIRKMSDEELAVFLDKWASGDIDYSKTFCDMCEGQFECDDCRLWWLKKEADS